MDISRLRLQSLGSESRLSSLPRGLRTTVELSPPPSVRRTLASPPLIADDTDDIDGRVFAHFAAAWKARLDRFISDETIFRA